MENVEILYVHYEKMSYFVNSSSVGLSVRHVIRPSVTWFPNDNFTFDRRIGMKFGVCVYKLGPLVE